MPRTTEKESVYDPTIPLPPIPISGDEEPFADDEEPSEEEKPSNGIGGVPTDRSSYQDLSSY